MLQKLTKAVTQPRLLLARVALEARRSAMSARILARRRRPVDPGPAAQVRQAIMSFRSASPERQQMLAVTAARVDEALEGSGIRLTVVDASPPELAAANRMVFEGMALDVTHTARDLPLAISYLELLEDVDPGSYAYVQFDDQLSVGLSPSLLVDAATVLERYRGLVPAVGFLWPTNIAIDHEPRQIVVTAHVESTSRLGTRYRFGPYAAGRALSLERAGGHTFGIFRNPAFGFYFNHMVVPVGDYVRRLRWYVDNVSTDAHTVELAAADGTVGPSWLHLAIPLDGNALLDLDFAHTAAAVRAVGDRTKAVYRALVDGYEVTGRVQR